MEKPIEISKFNLGGLADSKFSGIKNSLYKMIGLDPHSIPGLLKVAQKLTKDSGSTVTELCKVGVNSSNGIQYWFSSTSGKIWQNKNGTYTLVYTTAPAAGLAYCTGAYEYQGYIYFATQSRLHRIATASADGAANWTANIALNWKTFSVTDALFHPMVEQNLVLYIGDGNYVAQVDAGTFSANALDIKTPLRIKSLGKFGTDLLIGTYTADTVTKSELFRWNTWSVSFTNSDTIEEVGINAFLEADNYVFIQAGLAGNIYVYNGTQLELYKKIPGDYSLTKYGYVYPQSVANFHGEILFGFSNGSGDPADEGVYRIARTSRNYPYIMDLPYPISQRSGSDFVLTGVEIGAILVVGNNIYVAWKNGTSYGIDKLDWSNKLNGAYLETRMIMNEREKIENISKFVVAYASLPTGTSVAIQYNKNYGTYEDTTEIVDDDRKIVYSDAEGLDCNVFQVKWIMTTSTDYAPEIESGAVFIR